MKFAEEFEKKIISGEKYLTVRSRKRNEIFKVLDDTVKSECIYIMESDTFLKLVNNEVFNSKAFGFRSNALMYKYYDDYFNRNNDMAFIHELIML